MLLAVAHQDHRVGAAVLAACCTLLSSACTSQQAVAHSDGQEIANPILRQFTAICSVAMKDAMASFGVARDAGWKDSESSNPLNGVYRFDGTTAANGVDLLVLDGLSNAPASLCQMRGENISPTLAEGFETFEVPGYVETMRDFSSGTKRRLEGKTFSGEPIEIMLVSSTAQGAITITLSMSNDAENIHQS